MRLSQQQAAIPNKPVGGEIWQEWLIDWREHIAAHHSFNERINVSVCVSASEEMLLHATDRCMQMLAVPHERQSRIQIVQLGQGLLGQDRWRALDMSKEGNNEHSLHSFKSSKKNKTDYDFSLTFFFFLPDSCLKVFTFFTIFCWPNYISLLQGCLTFRLNQSHVLQGTDFVFN